MKILYVMSPTRRIINCTDGIYILYVDEMLKPYASTNGMNYYNICHRFLISDRVINRLTFLIFYMTRYQRMIDITAYSTCVVVNPDEWWLMIYRFKRLLHIRFRIFLCMMKMAYAFLIEILMERRLSKYIFYDERKFKRRTLDHTIFNQKSNYLFKDPQYAESVLISISSVVDQRLR